MLLKFGLFGKRTLLVSFKEKLMKGVMCGGGMFVRGLFEGIFSGIVGYFSVFYMNLFG